MSKNLTEESLLHVFPSALATSKNLYALASAIADELELLFSKNDLLAIYTNISSLPEDLLDILAKDFKVDWYFSNGTIESKRAQIASCFSVHRHFGTKSALVFALSALCPGTEIQEWFEYGGDPYYFKIICDLTEQTAPIAQSDIERVAKAVKPTRSVLEDSSIIYRSRNVIAVSVEGNFVCFAARICGTIPSEAVKGKIQKDIAEIQIDVDSVEFVSAAAGTMNTGTIPSEAVSGVARSGNINLGTMGDAAAYHARACGTSPGSLI